MTPSTELLERSRSNDRKAHHELYVMCFPVIYAVCSRYYNNKEDRLAALNMIFLRLIQGMNNYLKKENNIPFEQWLRRVTINYIIDEFRKQKKYKELITHQEEIADSVLTNHTLPEDKYAKEEILMAIEKLPPMSKTVFNLYAIDGYKHEEIADLLGISSGTSKVHLFKARKRLQEMLASFHTGKSRWNKPLLQ